MDSLASRRKVRSRPGRLVVPAACVAALLLGACTQQAVEPEPWTPTASPVPTHGRLRSAGAARVLAGGAEAHDPQARQRSQSAGA